MPLDGLRGAVNRTIGKGLLGAAEAGRFPDPVIRAAIYLRLKVKVAVETRGGPSAVDERKQELLADRAAGPVTTHVTAANQQHYEVPSPFFGLILGPRLRYSSCYWPPEVTDLAEAEEVALAQTVERAGLVDGERILELGAGWGSLSLYMAERFPRSEIVTVSNSRTQKQHIDEQASARGLTNLAVVTADIGQFSPSESVGGELFAGDTFASDTFDRDTFDRVVSVEMFEHVRNHRELLRRISTWLRPGGTCFIHVFSHRTAAWHFDAEDSGDWMAKAFFAGGTMPSEDLLPSEQQHLRLVERHRLNGAHYAKTLQAWLDRLDGNRQACIEALASGDDPTPPELQLTRWRLFLLASIGTWGLAGGTEFGVSHYLFENPLFENPS